MRKFRKMGDSVVEASDSEDDSSSTVSFAGSDYYIDELALHWYVTHGAIRMVQTFTKGESMRVFPCLDMYSEEPGI
jgi:hypothetical protein